jgi:peptidyl-prolyl cis-trans isomerase SurA
MKYFARLLSPVLLLATCIAGAEEEAPEISLDPSGYRASKPEFVDAPDFEPDLIPGHTEQRQRYSMNRLVAIANNDVILSSELDDAINEIIKQLSDKGTPIPEHAVLVKQVLERLVVDSLQLQVAADNGITISDSMLNSEIQDLAKANNVSLSEFRDILERDGYNYNQFRENLRKQLIIQQIRRQMVASRIKVSDQEVENLLAMLKASGQSDVEYNLSHILIAIPEAASPEQIKTAEQRAGNILVRLRGGTEFAEIAIAESDGQTALEGGDIGWRSLGQVPGLFVDSVKTMQVGDVSDLIRSSGGFHIIKMTGKRGDEMHIVEQTRARHILLKPDTVNTDEEVQIRIQQLETRLRGGEDFATLARANSQDTLSAAKGGDLGWLNKGDTVPAFEEALESLQPGELSKPVKTQFGWHIVEVQERRTHDSTEDFERSKVRGLIRTRKYDEELFLWLRRLRDESYVEYRIDKS